MAYNREVRGPRIMYIYPSGSWPTGQYTWTRINLSTAERRPKPKGANLLLLPTAYSRSHSFSMTGKYSYDDSDEYYIRNTAENSTTPPIFPNEEYQSGRAAVVTKLRLKIKDEEWNLSTFVGELPETMKYFAKTLTTVVSTYRAVRRGDMRQVRKIRDSTLRSRGPGHRSLAYANEQRKRWLREANSGTHKVAEKWMEWRYAISPLMYDLDDMFKAVYSQRNVPVYRRKVTGARLRYQSKNLCYALGTTLQHETVEVEMMLRLGMIFRVDPRTDGFKRLGLLNPLATLWELGPLTFVADWFLPVGDYLSSLDALAGVSVLSTWESQRVSGTSTRPSIVYARLHPDFWSVERLTSTMSRVDSYSRTVGVDVSAQFPQFSLSLTGKRLLDAVSLAKLLFTNR